MNLNDISQKIDKKTAKIAVIGLGYVGLPLAAILAETGFDVTGADLIQERVDMINHGDNPIQGIEPGLDALLKTISAAGSLRATIDHQEISKCDIIFINVETPVNEKHKPEYRTLIAALESVSQWMKKGTLVIIESTIAPGTMQETVLPILEHETQGRLNKDFFLGYCPERVMPGKLLQNLRTMNRVIGGANKETADCMQKLYATFVEGDLDQTDWITAEFVKTVENSYRDVQIAFVNEVAMICEAKGADIWKVRKLVNKIPGRNLLEPGGGVGGHCIPKDPWLLVSSTAGTTFNTKLIPSARLINDSMPSHILKMLLTGFREKGINRLDAKVLILGYAYLQNSDDTRNSPSAILEHLLQDEKIQYQIHDPHVQNYAGDVCDLARGMDALVFMTAHDEYKNLDMEKIKGRMRNRILIDGRGIFRDIDQIPDFHLLQIGKSKV